MVTEKSIKDLIDKQIREMIMEFGDHPPKAKESLAGAIEKLLRAKPLAGDGNLDILALLKQQDADSAS